jgi:hypothetical protein
VIAHFRPVLDRLERESQDFDVTKVVRDRAGLSIAAASQHGFDMSLTVTESCGIVAFDRWEQTFDNPQEASELFSAAMRGDARLCIDVLGGRRWRWTLERRDAAGNWLAESTVGQPVWRFWGKPEVIYLRNTYARAR